MNNHKVIFLLILMLLITASLAGCRSYLSLSTGDGHNILREEDAKEFTIKKTVTESIKSIELKTKIADIELIKSDDYYVEIDYLYWDDEPEYKLESGNLTFDDENAVPGSYTLNFNLTNVIRIYLPENAPLDRISIFSSTGNVKLSGFVADNLRANVAYGNFTMKDCAAGKSVIKLASGNSHITDYQTGDLDFDNAYGSAHFTNINIGDSKLPKDISFDKIDINMSSGNADIDSINAESLEIDNSYGNIDCVGATVNSFDAKLSSGSLKVSNSDIKVADLRNSYGNITLELLGNEEAYSLDLETSYGNIKVNGKNYDDSLIKDNGDTQSITASLSSGDVRITFDK